MKTRGLLDNWTTREKLALACSVQKNGDQNWVSVSRAIKPYGEPHRPSDWFLPRNCATQYASFLEKVETPKRKRSDRGEIDVPSRQLVTKLTIERTEELKKLVVEQQNKYKKLKRDIESIITGQWDDNIKEKWDENLAGKEAEEEKQTEEEKNLKEEYASRAAVLQQLRGVRGVSASSHSNLSEVDENTQDSLADSIIDVSQADEDSMDAPGPPTVTIQPPSTMATAAGDAVAVVTKGNSLQAPLLSTLLQSSHKTPSDLQRIKQEQEQVITQEQVIKQETTDIIGEMTADLIAEMAGITDVMTDALSFVAMPSTSSTSQQLDVDDIASKVKEDSGSEHQQLPTVDSDTIKQEIKEECIDQETAVSCSHEKLLKAVEVKSEVMFGEELTEGKPDVHTDQDNESQDDDRSDMETATCVSVDEVSIKEEPSSPASSIHSSVSESRSIRRSRGSTSSGRRVTKVIRKSVADDGSSRHSEADNTDDDAARESDDLLSQIARQQAVASAFVESVPNSPASTGISDTEDEKAYKAWKKSIMLVWRSASNHKDASVFLHPVTNDIAPGYHNVVHRPMDMHTIKKNIENGTIRSTAEFQRDMMLMFTNAIMYNACNHNVYHMAKYMYDDVMEILEQYINTQLMVQSGDHKLLRGGRRGDDKEEESKKRRGSVEQHQEGGKTKKRKRTDVE